MHLLVRIPLRPKPLMWLGFNERSVTSGNLNTSNSLGRLSNGRRYRESMQRKFFPPNLSEHFQIFMTVLNSSKPRELKHVGVHIIAHRIRHVISVKGERPNE